MGIESMKVIRTFLVAVVAFTAAPSSPAASEEVGIVTFTVDNATQQFFQESMPVFFEHDVPGTLFAQIVAITGYRGDLSWDDVQTLMDHGWELGAHSYTHSVPLTKADDVTLEMELGAPAAYIYRKTGVYPTTFASPHGDYDERVLNRVRVYYEAHARGWGNGGVNRFDSTDHYRIHREQVDNTMTVAEACAELEKAGREGYWLVLMWHRVVEEPSYKYENSAEQFEGVISCAAEMRDRGIIRLMNMKEALKYVPHTPK